MEATWLERRLGGGELSELSAEMGIVGKLTPCRPRRRRC